MLRGRVTLLACAGLAACRFDGSGVAADDDPRPDAAPADARPDGPVDAAICPEPTARITVDGVPHEGVAAPATRVLLGDTVRLSSEGSCGPTPLTYRWQVSPVEGVRDTIAPADTAAAISVFARLEDAYTVSLTVRDEDGGAASTTIYAFDAVGFRRLATTPDKVRDLDVGGGRLWIGADVGAWRADLGALAALVDVGGEAAGAALPRKVEAVLWDDARAALWVGGADAAAHAWRVDYAAAPVAVTVPLTALAGNARVDDLALVVEPAPGTVAASTDRGLALSAGGAAFDAAFAPGMGGRAIAAAAETDETWALGAALYALDGGQRYPVFDGGTPTALAAAPDGAVWLAVDGRGVARVVRVGDGIAIDPWDDATGLPSRAVRGLWIERPGPAPGDVWVATQRGLARWKEDRDEWVVYGNPQGLQGHLDLRAVAVHTDGDRRVVIAGGNAGLVYAAVP